MKFYSYKYLLYTIARFDWWGLSFILFLVCCFIFSLYKYYKGHKETKYRELAIILSLTIIFLISSKISQYRNNSVSDNQHRNAIHFIEVVAEDFKVNKEFYRVISGDNGKNYLLEKIQLENPKIELIEVKK